MALFRKGYKSDVNWPDVIGFKVCGLFIIVLLCIFLCVDWE